MKILVPIKRVIDYAVKVRVDPTKGGVQLQNVKMSMNPFCEIAIEEAIRIKESLTKSKSPCEVVAVSIGPKQCSETIRTALAMGADRGVHLTTDMRGDYMELQPLAIAQLLKGVVEREEPDLVLLGKQSIDSDCGQTGPMLAGLLNVPQATYAAKITVDSSITVERETDDGTETIKLSTTSKPAIVTCDLRLNAPRYASMPNIMKAKKKKVDVFNAQEMAEELGVDLSPRNDVVEVYEPPARLAGEIVESVDELVKKLKEKGLLS